MEWVIAKDFTVDVGKEQIVEFIRTWDLEPAWIYSLNFLYSAEEEEKTSFHYLANFSTPSPQRPIPTAAGVYFVMDVSKVEPQVEPIDVHFFVESNRLKHTPGKTRFTEKWLLDIIECKIAASEAMRKL
ncbi:A-kinase anchor protein 14 [Stigmatopora nigra]